MAIVREGHNVILLVVDVQVGVMRNAWETPRIINNIGISVEKAGGLGVPIIWVQHSDNELIFNSPDWQLVPELSPAEGEIQIYKKVQLLVRANSPRRGTGSAWRYSPSISRRCH